MLPVIHDEHMDRLCEHLYLTFAVIKTRDHTGAGTEIAAGEGLISGVHRRSGAGVQVDSIKANITPITRATTQAVRDAMTVTDIRWCQILHRLRRCIFHHVVSLKGSINFIS